MPPSAQVNRHGLSFTEARIAITALERYRDWIRETVATAGAKDRRALEVELLRADDLLAKVL